MITLNKPKQVRIRLSHDDGATIDRIKGVLSETDVASFVLAAGLQAIRENGLKFAFPLRFQTDDEASHAEPMRAARPKLKAA